MARQPGSRILDAETTFHHRFEQVSALAEEADQRPQQQRLPEHDRQSQRPGQKEYQRQQASSIVVPGQGGAGGLGGGMGGPGGIGGGGIKMP